MRRTLLEQQREDPARVVMVLDQAERLFTGTGGEDPRALVHELEQLAEKNAWFRCLVVFRSDVFATSAVDETFGRYMVRAVRVPVMRRDEMRQAMSEPAKMVGITFEDGLIDRILDETGGGQALPLLAYNLQNLATSVPQMTAGSLGSAMRKAAGSGPRCASRPTARSPSWAGTACRPIRCSRPCCVW